MNLMNYYILSDNSMDFDLLLTLINFPNGRQTMRDDDGGSAFLSLVECFLDECF